MVRYGVVCVGGVCVWYGMYDVWCDMRWEDVCNVYGYW